MVGPAQQLPSLQSQPAENSAAANLISTLSATLSTQRKQQQDDDDEEEEEEGAVGSMVGKASTTIVEADPVAAGGDDVKGGKAAPPSRDRAGRRWQQLQLEAIEEQEAAAAERGDNEHIPFPMPTQPRSLSTKSPLSGLSPSILTYSKASIPTHPAVRGSIATKFRSQSMLNNLRAYGGVTMSLRANDDISSHQSSSMIEGHHHNDDDDSDSSDDDDDDDDDEAVSDQDGVDEEGDDEGQDENSMLFTLRNMKTAT